MSLNSSRLARALVRVRRLEDAVSAGAAVPERPAEAGPPDWRFGDARSELMWAALNIAGDAGHLPEEPSELDEWLHTLGLRLDVANRRYRELRQHLGR